MTLLKRIGFRPGSDRLWLTGDLVNRGSRSLDVLRYVKSLGNHAVTVLGNHDLHLLAVWAGAANLKTADTLADILDAPDCDELMEWLRQQPLLHEDPALGFVMTHAGIPPCWSLETARRRAREAEEILGGNGFLPFMARLYGNEPSLWQDSLAGWDRLRFIVNAFTRMRYCGDDGRLLLDYKGRPGSQPPGYHPWFSAPGREHLPQGLRLIAGHWSTLGFHQEADVISIDTGCLWGGRLTALQLDADARRTSIECPGAVKPG